MIPRLPMVPEFWVFSRAGRELADWHLGYESVEPWPLDDARKSLGPFADALALDQTVSGQHARQVLAWEPHGPGLIADLSVQKHFQQSNGA